MRKIAKVLKTLVFIFISLVIIFALIFGYFYITENNPKISNVRVTNITANSATISWQTKANSKGRVILSIADNFNLTDKWFGKADLFHDERDIQLNSQGEYELIHSDVKRNWHHVILRNLEPGTEYHIAIDGYLKFFDKIAFTTFSEDYNVATPDPIYGDVINFMTNEPEPSEGIVYYQVKSIDEKEVSQLYSSIVNANSSWSGDLSNLVDPKGKLLQWNQNDHKLHLEAFTDIGEGIGVFNLEDYKPLDNLIVNVRYFPSLTD